MCGETETQPAEPATAEIIFRLPSMNLGKLEQFAIELALVECDGNRTKAAKILGIAVRTLQRKIVRLGLPMLPVSTCRSSRN